jgi:hypothetical protein
VAIHSVGIYTHVITFEVGAVLQDSLTQAPAYCFSQERERLLNADRAKEGGHRYFLV